MLAEVLIEDEMDALARATEGYEEAEWDSCVTHDFASDMGYVVVLLADEEYKNWKSDRLFIKKV